MKNYSIFDVNKPIMEANKEFQATSPINAAKAYLKSIGNEKTPKKSGSNYVQISAREFIVRDGQKYFKGNQNWYEIK